MTELITEPAPKTQPLTRDLAEQYISQLTLLANQIPGVEYTSSDLLTEQKGERQLHAKWQHSLIVIEDKQPLAFIMGYERESEGNHQYPENTIYVSELAVSKFHQQQGIATRLLRDFLELNNSIGFKVLDGKLNYSVQTNSADWNQHVVDLYKSFGFSERAHKSYPNRTDVILGVKASELIL